MTKSVTSLAKEIANIEAEAPKKPKRWGETVERHDDPLIAEFLKVSPPERGTFLSARNFEAATKILDAYIHSSAMTLEDILACESPNWRQRMLDRVCGNSAQGLAGISKNFLIAPAYKGDAVAIEEGVFNNKRRHAVITEPTECTPKQAVVALLQCGASSAVQINRGRLVELQSPDDWQPFEMPDEVREVFHNKPEPKRKGR